MYMSLVVRKPAFCICENKDADQLRGNHEADQRLCFRYMDCTIPLLPKRNFKPLAILCDCTKRLMSDLVRNSEDWFSHNEAHICKHLQNLHGQSKPVYIWSGTKVTIGKQTPYKLSFVYTSQVKLTVRTEPKFG